MRLPRKFLVVAFVFLALSALVPTALLLRPNPPDPEVQGRPYSYWLQRLMPSVAPSFVTASNAVRTVAGDGFPLLRKYLTSKDSTLRLFLFSKGIGTDEFVAATQLQVSACNAVAVLGDDAAELMPLVFPLLTNRFDSVRLAALRAMAANSLAFPDQHAFLTNAIVSDTILVCRVHAARAALKRDVKTNAVLELLATSWINRLTSEKEVRQFLWVLEQLDLPTERVSHLLEAWARSPDAFTRRFVAHLFLHSESFRQHHAHTLHALTIETNRYVSLPAQKALEKMKIEL